MLVQATIEDGPAGLITSLESCRQLHPSKLFRGTVYADPDPKRSLYDLNNATFDQFHEFGVRSIRIHGSYGGSGDDIEWIQGQFRRASSSYPVRKFGWSLSAQLSLEAWAANADFLLHDPALEGITITADHNGCTGPASIHTRDLENLVSLLRSGRFYIKIGALHRRSPGAIDRMKPIIQRLAEENSQALLWGSDWPHINGKPESLDPSPPVEGVDTLRELQLLRSWLSEKQWTDMLVTNPERLFGT